MLKGQAKTDYQREYMRKRRSNKGLTLERVKALYTREENIRAVNGALGTPEFDADGNTIYEE